MNPTYEVPIECEFCKGPLVRQHWKQTMHLECSKEKRRKERLAQWRKSYYKKREGKVDLRTHPENPETIEATYQAALPHSKRKFHVDGWQRTGDPYESV